MTSDPYTYLTIAITSDERPRVTVGFHTPALRAVVRRLESGRPFLVLESDEAYVSISTTGAGPATANDVETARQIFNAAARYLADCERMHADQSADSDQLALPLGETAA
ncbi:hypothetical protein [Microbispora triticiradicis]|uniref:Uncharacterized protein n=2 Tax=Microbispora TaxID=2005 RepID=A0ABY3LTH8_9ACTN|nr:MULTISPECIES: hypothetical protein [Microbispora]TLP66064.1 hypothetical protein FED44_00600 [Microbispora fusca]TYB53580.1 hypothetical protein FXF59_23555 [Microbispora tritici]